jgi:hypothetical protein
VQVTDANSGQPLAAEVWLPAIENDVETRCIDDWGSKV